MSIAGIIIPADGGEGFVAPGPGNFDLPAVFSIGSLDVTKPMLQAVLAAVLVFGFLYAAARQRKMVPGRLQFAGEEAYSAVRNSMARDIIGSHDFKPYVPYLVTVFFFILMNNLFSSIPFIQFPTFSRVSMAYALAGVSWLVYNSIGVKKHGLLGYLKLQCVPSGIKGPMLALLIPLEFLSNLVIRPVTLSLRLFCNMFAGHLLLILFATGGHYMLVHGAPFVQGAGIVAWILAVAISFLELLVQFLQAYVFTLLNAMYIQGALADEH
ncbi:MAG: F0F1 ATP synthase subunit A [Marmoricola sp.]